MSEEASCDKVVVSDTSEHKGDVDRSSNEESELRDIIGWGWYKGEKELRRGWGVRHQDYQGGGEQGAKKMSDVSRGRWVWLWRGERAEMSMPRKRGEEQGVSVALLRGGVGLWSLCTGGGKKW